MGLFGEPSRIEKAVAHATSDSLTTEDWSRIIAVCNLVSEAPTKYGPEAVKALRARLATNNGNVQLYSLTLLNALAQNCGPVLQREVASPATKQSLLALGNGKTHKMVVTRLVDILGQLRDYGLEDVYQRFAPAPTQPDTPPPTIKGSEEDEDEDLRRAMELSLREAHPRPRVRALYDFTATEPGELDFREGDVIEVLDRVYKEWWKGLLNGREGIFPVNYVAEVPAGAGAGASVDAGVLNDTRVSDAKAPLNAASVSASVNSSAAASVTNTSVTNANADAETDAILAQTQKVNHLLHLLQTDCRSDEVHQMYNEVSALRPRVVQLIDEYTERKQRLVDLNQKLVHARRTYDQLMVRPSYAPPY